MILAVHAALMSFVHLLDCLADGLLRAHEVIVVVFGVAMLGYRQLRSVYEGGVFVRVDEFACCFLRPLVQVTHVERFVLARRVFLRFRHNRVLVLVRDRQEFLVQAVRTLRRIFQLVDLAEVVRPVCILSRFQTRSVAFERRRARRWAEAATLRVAD